MGQKRHGSDEIISKLRQADEVTRVLSAENESFLLSHGKRYLLRCDNPRHSSPKRVEMSHHDSNKLPSGL